MFRNGHTEPLAAKGPLLCTIITRICTSLNTWSVLPVGCVTSRGQVHWQKMPPHSPRTSHRHSSNRPVRSANFLTALCTTATAATAIVVTKPKTPPPTPIFPQPPITNYQQTSVHDQAIKFQMKYKFAINAVNSYLIVRIAAIYILYFSPFCSFIYYRTEPIASIQRRVRQDAT